MARDIKKLEDGDPGFNPQQTVYQIIEPGPPQVRHISLEQIDSQIAGLQQQKAEEMQKFDNRIQALQQLKTDLTNAKQ